MVWLESIRMRPGTRYTLEVNPRIPQRLARLQELAGNLWYSWDRPTRALFARLIRRCGTRSATARRRCSSASTSSACSTPRPTRRSSTAYRVLAAFDAYHAEPPFKQNSGGFRPGDLVAYFCAEFGVHESLPIYSGGLGILAGDHCKAASDLPAAVRRRRPALPPGLLRADHRRRGHASAPSTHDSDFDDLPIAPVRATTAATLEVDVEFPGASVRVKVWQAKVGHVTLYLLDTDLPENSRARPRHHAPPLRRRPHHAHRAGDRARRRRRARARGDGPQADGVAHQRRPRRVPGPRARARAGRRRA